LEVEKMTTKTSKQIQEEIYSILGKEGLSGIAKMPKYAQENLLEKLKEKSMHLN